MVMRMMSNVKLCKKCRHLTDSYPRMLNSFLTPNGYNKPMKLMTLECPHWFDESLDDLERELDRS